MNINEVKERVEEAMQDKQEFADLCVHLVPELIAEIEKLQTTVKDLRHADLYLPKNRR